jgi:hypothetical protein
MSTTLKGFITAVIAFIVTAVSSQLTTGINVWYIVIATVAYTLWYLGKNALLPSISLFGTIDLRDLLSGLLLAVGATISSSLASIITAGTVNWHELGITVLGAVIAYLGTKFGTSPAKT